MIKIIIQKKKNSNLNLYDLIYKNEFFYIFNIKLFII